MSDPSPAELVAALLPGSAIAVVASPAALPSDADRVPRWPDVVVGSVTHTAGFCAAAVAWRRDLRGPGIDAERAIDATRAGIMRLVARPAEAAWLARFPDPRADAGSARRSSSRPGRRCTRRSPP